MTLEEDITRLKIRKALILGEIEMLSFVNDSVYTRFGKIEAELLIKEKQLLREKENDFQ
ncbi:hypothetical protein [Flavobacterium panacagri]|uniref:hypothetical protein n=1 Tax=Flavobacterium panacagri TaxID=3034146 RepID=UPI0025A51105|nr:hypothetical protein [Flavobacterium panacagri]